MSNYMNTELKKRTLSFIWRLGAMIAVAILGFFTDILPDIATPEIVAVVVALIIGEITKFLNKEFHLQKSFEPEIQTN